MPKEVTNFLNKFKADVVAGTASLSGVTLHKVKDDKVIFIDITGSKFAIPINNIQKITLNKVT